MSESPASGASFVVQVFNCVRAVVSNRRRYYFALIVRVIFRLFPFNITANIRAINFKLFISIISVVVVLLVKLLSSFSVLLEHCFVEYQLYCRFQSCCSYDLIFFLSFLHFRVWNWIID